MTGSDWPELPLLQHRLEFTLDVQRNIADFLQQNGTPSGKGEETPPCLSGAGKGPLFISKKLRFGQGGSNMEQSEMTRALPFRGHKE